MQPGTVTRNSWIQTVSLLLSGTLSKERHAFHQSMEELFVYVRDKHNGRCISKKLFDDTKRSELIEKLFKFYEKDATPLELCRSSFLRKITKHDRQNDANLDRINQITSTLVEKMPAAQTLSKDPAVLFWMRELGATIFDPSNIKEHNQTLEGVPQNFQKILYDGRLAIGENLQWASSNKWLNVQTIEAIIEGINAKINPHFIQEGMSLNEETVVPYFVQHYRILVSQGREFADKFQASLVEGLRAFCKDPMMQSGANVKVSKSVE